MIIKSIHCEPSFGKRVDRWNGLRGAATERGYMHYSTKKGGGLSGRSSSGLLASGASTVTLHQRMTIARNRVKSGSIRSDWKAVGADIREAVAKVKREFERA